MKVEIIGVRGRSTSTIIKWGISALCILLPAIALVQVSRQFVNPPAPQALEIVRDIPLPSAFPDARRTALSPFTPGLALTFDHFDLYVPIPRMGGRPVLRILHVDSSLLT